MLDEIVAGGAVAVPLEALDVDAELVAGADATSTDEVAATAAVDVELEWLLESRTPPPAAPAPAPHTIRFSIGPG